MSKRVFKDNASYKNPAIWIDSKDQVWTGPLARDGNMHFARFSGFMDDAVTPIWVLMRSECPEDCVLVGFKLQQSSDVRLTKKEAGYE